MPRHRSVVAVAVATLATALTVSAAAVAHPSAHANKHAAGHSRQFGFGPPWGPPGSGSRRHHPRPGQEEGLTAPGTTAAWGDVVAFTGFTSTPLGEVNGFPETKRATTSPPSRFTLIPGVEGFTGAENITIYAATTPPGTTAETSVTQNAGLDECNPCTLDNAAGQPVATGSIDMHWFSASGEKGAHQQVALLEHGTGGLANYHGVLTHPSAKDPRCAAGEAAAEPKAGELYVGCYTGTIHAEQCITGVTRGLNVAPGQSVCVAPGAEILGRTTVGRDGELFAEGAAFLGGIRSEGAAGFSLCGSDVAGPVSVTGTTGPVLIGEPSTGDCEGNTIFGPLTVAGNGCATCDVPNEMDTGAVDVSGNTVVGPLRAEDNVGAFVLGYFTPNRVFGPTTNSGNS